MHETPQTRLACMAVHSNRHLPGYGRGVVNVIEKMARAMHVETYAVDDFDEQREEFRQEWITLAKAALTALEEPSEEMLNEAVEAMSTVTLIRSDIVQGEAEKVMKPHWAKRYARAAINAALQSAKGEAET